MELKKLDLSKVIFDPEPLSIEDAFKQDNVAAHFDICNRELGENNKIAVIKEGVKYEQQRN